MSQVIERHRAATAAANARDLEALLVLADPGGGYLADTTRKCASGAQMSPPS
jgi:hypothetical protein